MGNESDYLYGTASRPAATHAAAWSGWRRWVRLLGPGVMVMLADTDAGSIITAAQSGAAWGYHLILPELLLIPILYVVQEMTVRLGMVTGRGHGELIRDHFGWGWALLSVATLFVAAAGALVTEFAGIRGVARLVGIPGWLAVATVVGVLGTVVLRGGYRQVERIGIAAGLLELAFVPAAFLARPSWAALGRALISLPWGRPGYLFLLAANVGAVIMPWMVFYQQGAVIDKGLTVHDLRTARWDTALGAVATQGIMVAVLVAVAATVGRHAAALSGVGQIAQALTPFLGPVGAVAVFGLGLLGAAVIAALVVSIAGAWGVTEVLGQPRSLNHRWHEAPLFYLLYILANLTGAALVFSGIPLVRLTLDVEVMNALLLPVVLGFLLALEARVLPARYRMRGAYRLAAWTASALVIGFGLLMAILTLAGRS
ncbi:Mn2+ and Fe2+ transporters of the NRAMP family [Candidatus Hydrogenisulfobacillus filiaventi]|uniref:Mn2+ and Fe2+ transporters of the NRAMP family n=1 Tax=Candidatus Hydrogenisulfobacillus filiaventi TaxID=2707344 RepID=A0A6F8ZDM4_9FIRM|nr:divalent metal cation transporter [Bacillota bacterium]CAB1127794.1 Mn2+ and Fe2+ transporters of the NRAMP family [Candidatus Hydrogenisulfobacillus filiaventi]